MTFRTIVKSVSAMLVLQLSLLTSLPGYAQTTNQSANQTAKQATTKSIDVPASDLGIALNTFASDTGSVIYFDSRLVRGKTSTGLSGNYNVAEALTILLQGSNLKFVVEDDGSYRIIEADGAGPLMLAPIKVKGENIERVLLETNTSINVQTDIDITRSNDKRISDAFSRAANVNINGTGLQAFSFSIRGINSSGVGGAGNGSLASLTVDGAAFTTQQLSRGYNSLFDVEQVEILRGPQSTSQARNSLAGAVVISTKNPEFEQNTEAVVAYGNYGTYELGVVNTGPINDEFAYRITAHRLNTDGFIENTALGKDDYNFNNTDTLRGKILYSPQAIPLEILLSYAYVQADALNDVSSWFPDTQQFISGNPYGDGGMDSEQHVGTLNISYDLSDAWTIESNTAYNDFISEDLNSTYATSIPDRNQAWFATADQEEWNQTLRATYDSDRLRGSFGVFYSDDTNVVLRDGVALQNALNSGLDGDAEINSPTDTATQALFGELDIDVLKQLTVTLGGRFEKVNIDTVGATKLNLILPPPAPYTIISEGVVDTSLDASTDFSVFLPKAGITYALVDNQRMGFTYSEGYRQGGVTADVFTLQIGQYDPEFVKNYELSYKGEFTNGVSLNANLFYLDWEDQQVLQTPLGSPLSQTVNAGKSEVMGGELELTWRSNLWDTYASIGYNETEFKDFVTTAGDFSGNEFPNGPSLTAAMGGFLTLNDWTYGAEITHRNGFFTNQNNAFKTDSLTLVDVSLAYQLDDFTLRGFVNNVFDEVKQINETFFIEEIPHGNFTDPMTFGIQIRYGY